MSEETSVREALVQISWYLNFRSGEEVTPEEIEESTQLSWAMAYNCLITLEKIQRLCPRLGDTEDGVSVKGDKLSNIEDDCVMLVFYMMTQKKNTDLREPLKIEKHPYLRDSLDTIEKAESLGWIKWENDGEIVITPVGIKIAGPEHSKIENTRNL